MTHHVHHHCLVGGRPSDILGKISTKNILHVTRCMVQPEEIEKIQDCLKKVETSVIPPQLKRMYLETEEKEVNPLYVSLDVKYIIS